MALDEIQPFETGLVSRLKRAFTRHTLWWAIGFSVLLHAVLIAWRFADPISFNRVFEDTSLEVVLVNARSDSLPGRAQAIAQVRLSGGGQAPGLQRASTPLPPSAVNESGTDIGAMQRQIEALKLQQMRLLTQLQQELSALTQENTGEDAHAPERQARQERRQQLTRQLAQIEPRVEKTQGGPRKRYISPATQEAVYALYYDKLRRTIETRGTLNFPQVGGQKLYGQLSMVITVDGRGRLVQTEVVKTSGQPLLDQRAVAIVRSAAPFDAFSANMRRQADQIVVVTRFQFSKDGSLETRMLAAQPRQP
ncbi:energy transducer TonB [Limnohabitans sp.]|jgi:protein TonB|uniref:energy transducer TonB n=1 Tax=Limnohabitans sp. TaxID=1907725 RepID=UPI00289900BA|nr:energy transducer TonB [Limnohabitans sp.]